MAALPTPRPTMKRPTANCATEYAAVCKTVPTTNTTHAAQMGIFRPNRSAVRPAPTAPTKAPPLVNEVTSSCSLVDKTCPSDVPMVTRTEEM
jgi:hypothetical protein